MSSKIVIFEGQDRCFKTTNVKEVFDFFTKEKEEPCNILHYNGIKVKGEKGKVLNKQQYENMFKIIKWHWENDINLILDRSHIGEMVYSHYRDYSAEYIYDLEKKYIYNGFWKDIYLNLMIDYDVESLIKRDDNNSFSIDKNNLLKESSLFINAVEKSFIKNKNIINITNKSKDSIKNNIIKFICNKSKDSSQ